MKPQYLALLALSFLATSKYLPPQGPTSLAHSHNDFAQDQPLDLALQQGFSSIEVDVTDRRDDIAVVHLGFTTYGMLGPMYLDRLQKRVNEKGSIYGDGKKFYIWIEMRDIITGDAVVPLLTKLLAKYSMFSIHGKNGKEVQSGPVQAILINSRSEAFFKGRETAPACLGRPGFDTTRKPREEFECWNYLRWDHFFTWNGTGKMPESEMTQLRLLQAGVHSWGLRTRFFNTPDTREFWEQVKTLPFDLVGTDRLKETMEVLRTPEISGTKFGHSENSQKSQTRSL